MLSSSSTSRMCSGSAIASRRSYAIASDVQPGLRGLLRPLERRLQLAEHGVDGFVDVKRRLDVKRVRHHHAERERGHEHEAADDARGLHRSISPSITSSAWSTIAKPSRSSASVMHRGGMHVKFECLTNVNNPCSLKYFANFVIAGDDDAYGANGSPFAFFCRSIIPNKPIARPSLTDACFPFKRAIS